MTSISYLITVHNEDRTLKNLLNRITNFLEKEDEIIILDDYSDNDKTKKILSEFSNLPNIKIIQHALNRNYGEHKNFGNSLCKNEWIFQIDGDELPSEILLNSIKEIIIENNSVELFLVPRINDFLGVTSKHAQRWGWQLTPYKNRYIVQWPDYQGRIYKNIPERIKWDRRLHEKIEGYLPKDFSFALYHDKTIEIQEKTNQRYNKLFTPEENRGHKGFNT